MELHRQTETAIDISTAAEVFDYLYSGEDPIEVMARVEIGDDIHPIVGNGAYALDVFLDDVPLSPQSVVHVASGRTRTIIPSRHIPLVYGDRVTLKVTGRSADTAVSLTSSLRDVTPAKVTDLVGSGAVPVDHDYGGTDELAVQTPDGVGIAGVSVIVYYAADYDASRRSAAYVIATGKTTVGGRWVAPILINPGDYVLVMEKSPGFRAQAKRLTVS